MTNNESVFRVCGLLLLAALILPACGGAPQRDDAQLAALNQRVELLTLFVACADETKLQLLSEAAPELGLKAKCKEYGARRAEIVAAKVHAEEALRERSNVYWQHAVDTEPREEPWATDSEAKLKAIYDDFRGSEEFEDYSKRYLWKADCSSLTAPEIQCRTLICRMNFTVREGTERCTDAFWMTQDNEWFDNGGGTSDPGKVSMTFLRKGFLESDLMTMGVEEALANEPRDDLWAAEAEKSLVTAAAERNVERHYRDCIPLSAPDCRSVTCRVTLPILQGNCRADLFSSAWPSLASWRTASTRSADGQSRTYYLVREGFVFADAL